MLNGLDLFSGIGGITLALSEWVRPVAYCEIDIYAAGVLFSRMLDGSIPIAPIFPDITKLTKDFLPCIDIIYGGFPCQDISNAGTRAGLAGERSGLFFEIVRLLDECRPKFLFLENVPGIITNGLDRVTAEIASRGYDCRWKIISAAGYGAPHIRKRWWLLANANKTRRGVLYTGEQELVEECKGEADSKHNGTQESLADMEKPSSNGLEESRNDRISGGQANSTTNSGWWSVEPDVGRVVNGLPFRVDRIKCLGNSVVPQCAKEAFKKLMGLN